MPLSLYKKNNKMRKTVRYPLCEEFKSSIIEDSVVKNSNLFVFD